MIDLSVEIPCIVLFLEPFFDVENLLLVFFIGMYPRPQ